MKTLTCTSFLVLLLCVAGYGQRNCGSMEYLANQLKNNPEFQKNLEKIEDHTRNFQRSGDNLREVYTIPVVVHVIYNNGTENITDNQIYSQIQVLNEDFRRLNSDADNTWSQAADIEIQFCLASVDPDGNSTSGITRTATTNTAFSTNNEMKYDNTGGKSAWPASNYLNIWVCDISGGILGYAQFPGGAPSSDGVVVDYQYFGNTGTASAPFDLGRTATHEVGHYLNLRHIWGDGDCNVDDLVSDTPIAGGPNYGCNKGSVSCTNTDMVENYMDYSDDGCMNLFTLGQKNRMRALFSPGGFRNSLLSSPGCGNQSGATCFDGIQNGLETGIDCGGNCAPCQNVCTGNMITVQITLDNYPEETSWAITNSSGQTLASGGTYGSSPDGSTVTSEHCLPNGCYNFNIYDSYGDGICCAYGNGSYSVLSASNVLVSGGAFGSSESVTFCVENNVQPSCSDGVQNGNETGVDCGGPDCPSCPTPPTCSDGIQNGNETGVDCGGTNCPSCPTLPTCTDGIQNGNEAGVDCGGSDCAPCPTCTDGIQNGNEAGVDCGGSDCTPCGDTGGSTIFGHYFETGFDGWADGGSDCNRYASGTYASEGTYSIQLRDNSGTSSSMTSPSQNLSQYSSATLTFDFYMNSMENGEDFFLDFYTGSSWVRLATYASGSGYSNGVTYTKSVTVVNGLSSNNLFRFTCDASSNADQVYIDAVILTSGSGGGGGGNPTCDDGIQNGNETGVDCGGTCAPCQTTPTCTDGIQNGNETGVDCGGTCAPCQTTPTCTDGIQNGNETGLDCGGPDCSPCATCYDGTQNGDETGIDCGGVACDPCQTSGSNTLFGHFFESGMDGWIDGGSDCFRISSSYAYEGSYSIRLRDNSGDGSSMSSPNYPLSDYSTAVLSFYFYPNSMESGENIVVSMDKGNGWQVIGSFTSGSDFNNGSFYQASVTLANNDFGFTENCSFRIQCNASTNSDQVYIDQVELTGYYDSRIAGSGTSIELISTAKERGQFVSDNDTEFSIVPNPASQSINITAEEEFTAVHIMSITGKLVKTVSNKKFKRLNLDISELNAGLYLISLETAEEVLTERFVKQ